MALVSAICPFAFGNEEIITYIFILFFVLLSLHSFGFEYRLFYENKIVVTFIKIKLHIYGWFSTH